MTAIVPYPSDGRSSNEVGFFEARRLRSEDRRTSADIARRTTGAWVTEVQAQLTHGQNLRDLERQGELTETALEVGGRIYNRLVKVTGGDEAKAEFLTHIAVAGRDNLREGLR